MSMLIAPGARERAGSAHPEGRLA